LIEKANHIMQAVIDVALTLIGIPTFTASFVFATWLFLLPKANLAPAPSTYEAQAPGWRYGRYSRR